MGSPDGGSWKQGRKQERKVSLCPEEEECGHGAALYNERLKTKWQGEEVPTEGRRRRWRT